MLWSGGVGLSRRLAACLSALLGVHSPLAPLPVALSLKSRAQKFDDCVRLKACAEGSSVSTFEVGALEAAGV